MSILKKNDIKPQTHILVMQNRLTCPYYDGHKCLIYEVRPLICKEFYCYKKKDIQTAKKFEEEKRITVDMWAIAKEIDRIKQERNKKHANKIKRNKRETGYVG